MIWGDAAHLCRSPRGKRGALMGRGGSSSSVRARGPRGRGGVLPVAKSDTNVLDIALGAALFALLGVLLLWLFPWLRWPAVGPAALFWVLDWIGPRARQSSHKEDAVLEQPRHRLQLRSLCAPVLQCLNWISNCLHTGFLRCGS